ncbi:DUF1769-domain-containing protein [Xylariaceae sp. FL0804]|nr:DUF1769-domain-containing protein [Xylariaceae sp. FL0804]
MADKYILRVTAGPGYDVADHVEVPVNRPETVRVSSALADAEVNVRVRNYRGLPRDSPATSPYFAREPHAANGDQYSIAIRFTPKRPPPPTSTSTSGPSSSGSGTATAGTGDKAEVEKNASPPAPAAGISGHDLQFGNDFDHPIRDRLPPGFGYAMSIVKWWIDPGLDGDAHADRPHLYGPALSSFNFVHVGRGGYDHDPVSGCGLVFDEGADEDDEDCKKARERTGAPGDAKGRRKWALGDGAKSAWTFEYGRPYCLDFFNPYLDFGEFALRLPGFTLPIMKYWDGQPLSVTGSQQQPQQRKRSHTLRYVLRNRTTGDTYLVVLFTLHLREDVNDDGSLKPAGLAAARGDREPPATAGGSGKEEEGGVEEARKKFEDVGLGDKEEKGAEPPKQQKQQQQRADDDGGADDGGGVD